MPFVQHKMTALVVANPEEAKSKILEALSTSGLHMGKAAKAIGCSHVTLLRWIDKLKLEAAVTSLKKKATKEGWHHESKGGRPPSATPPEKKSKRRALDRSDAPRAR